MTQAVAWIEDKWIYPTQNNSQSRLAWLDGEFIHRAGGGTVAFIRDGSIYLNRGGYTGYFVKDKWIYGPDAQDLPWL